MDFTEKFKQAFSSIEAVPQFMEMDKSGSGIFYTLYIREKRLFYAMNVLRNVDDKEVSHIEILPLLRAYIEGFFHLVYVINEEDKEKVKTGYKYLSEYSQAIIASKFRTSEHIGEDVGKFIESFGSKVALPREYDFLNSPKKLAEKIGMQEIWAKEYNIINSFLHFNPNIYHNYGAMRDGRFHFNASESDKRNEETVYETIDRLTALLIGEITEFLQNEELISENFVLLSDFAEQAETN